jgi:hypothetical protein
LKRAYQDGVFGHIQFQLVDQITPGDNRQQMEDIARLRRPSESWRRTALQALIIF